MCFAGGLLLSTRKPLWNDESFSQSQNIEKVSYLQFLLGQARNEGNKCPLFYMTQKAVTQIAGYEFPYEWKRQWLIEDMRSQILLRLNPNFFMALALAALFYYFARMYSLGTGLYALAVALSFFMVWFYWVDARPYAMWFCLSTFQALLFLTLIKTRDPDISRRAYLGLGVTHWLMAFTITIAVLQIAVIAFFLWFFKERALKKHLLVTVAPVGIGLFYYLFTPSELTRYFPLHNPEALLFTNVNAPWLVFMALYGTIAGCYAWAVKKKRFSALAKTDALGMKDINEGGTLLAVMGGMYAAAFVLLSQLMARIVPPDEAAHYIHERYFFFLVPVAVIVIVVGSRHVFLLFRKNLWMLTNVSVILGGLIGLAYLDTFLRLVAKHIYF